jgi:hypothetical protein
MQLNFQHNDPPTNPHERQQNINLHKGLQIWRLWSSNLAAVLLLTYLWRRKFLTQTRQTRGILYINNKEYLGRRRNPLPYAIHETAKPNQIIAYINSSNDFNPISEMKT